MGECECSIGKRADSGILLLTFDMRASMAPVWSNCKSTAKISGQHSVSFLYTGERHLSLSSLVGVEMLTPDVKRSTLRVLKARSTKLGVIQLRWSKGRQES